MGVAVRRGAFTGLLLGLTLACATAAHATVPAPADGTVAAKGGDGAAGARPLPAGAAMPLAGRRLPPPGYLDYCLRFRDRDQGCAW